jgi:2-polyprenyl-6-methoxyphenol hydroxylase-like FAD-dependent oxidoreductase
MLSPNALKILDSLGVYARVRPRGYEFANLVFRSDDDQPVDTFEFGSKDSYGYKALRVYRFELINVLLDMLREAGVKVEYGKKFVRVVGENQRGSVEWEFADGSIGRARVLVGADGIHSRVRKHLYPDQEPRFTNMIGVTAAVPTAQLQAEADYPLPVTIMNKKHGAFVIAPQLIDGSEVLIGKQRRLTEELDRAGWDRLLNDKARSVGCLRQGSEDFPSIMGRAASDISYDKINLWPFYVVPKLDTWVSKEHAQVVILGDAAHAIPPTAGQGVNQAFEDVYTFAGVLARKMDGVDMKKALRMWQTGRQARVDRVLELNAQINQRRLPQEADTAQDAVAEEFDLTWLYAADFGRMVEEWAKAE